MFIGNFDPLFGSNNTSASPKVALFAAADLTKPESRSINANYSSNTVREKQRESKKRGEKSSYSFYLSSYRSKNSVTKE
jgi:hypothetical protein